MYAVGQDELQSSYCLSCQISDILKKRQMYWREM